MNVIINIISKCMHKNRILWYLDENGIRYYYNEIVYIIKNKSLPINKQFITRFSCADVHINMLLDKNGNLRCKDKNLRYYVY